jgi:adenylate cyclase
MKLKLTIILTFIFFQTSSLFALEPITVENGIEKYPLGLYLEILEDKNRKWTIEDVTNPELQDEWIQSKASQPSYGFTESAYWVRFKINKQNFYNSMFLEIGYPLIDYIDLYIFEKEKLISTKKSGDLIQFKDREIQHRTFIFDIQSQEEKIIYLRLRTEGPLKFPMTLWTNKGFFDSSKIELILWGFYFGSLIVMVLYHVFIYFSLRDKYYLYYVAYISSAILAQLTLHGFASLFFPSSPELVNISLPVLLNIDFLFGTVFCMKFLDTKHNIPKFHKVVMTVFILIALSIFLTFFSGYSAAMKVTMLFLMLTPVILFIAGVSAYLSGIKRARFFLLAWIPLLTSLIIISLDAVGVIKSSFFTYNSVQIGTLLEVLLLSLALADRINITKKEREAALQSQLVESQKVASLGIALQKFVPREFLECLGKGDITNIKLGDNIEKYMTVLFSDIRSFTEISEKMSPEKNFSFLNSYLKNISPIIRENGGFVDKYIGDSIMALFVDKADDALQAAIAMKKELTIFNEARIKAGEVPIETGIGIHSGSLILGTIGEEQRMEGTVISDAVNLASRIEGLTKIYNAHILISIDTFSRIANASDYNFRTIDYIKVKGKEEAVGILEILDGDTSQATLKKIQSISDFERGLNSFIMEDFENSILFMQKVLNHNPQDTAAKQCLLRAEDYLKNGKPSNWDGSLSMNTK